MDGLTDAFFWGCCLDVRSICLALGPRALIRLMDREHILL